MQMVERARPTVWVAEDQQKTANRLHQLQGWESYKNALFSLGEEPVAMKPVEENFPTDTEL